MTFTDWREKITGQPESKPASNRKYFCLICKRDVCRTVVSTTDATGTVERYICGECGNLMEEKRFN